MYSHQLKHEFLFISINILLVPLRRARKTKISKFISYFVEREMDILKIWFQIFTCNSSVDLHILVILVKNMTFKTQNFSSFKNTKHCALSKQNKNLFWFCFAFLGKNSGFLDISLQKIFFLILHEVLIE